MEPDLRLGVPSSLTVVDREIYSTIKVHPERVDSGLMALLVRDMPWNCDVSAGYHLPYPSTGLREASRRTVFN